jgi:polysaccharide pyruvyl transferase WcaK-like protein
VVLHIGHTNVLNTPSMSTPKGRVAILFANLKGNLGDFAILKAMIGEVERQFGEIDIDVFTHPLVGIDKPRLEEFKSRSSGITFKEPPYCAVIDPSARIMVRTCFRKKAQTRLIRKFASQIADQVVSFSEYKMILVAGGDQWSGRKLGLFMFGTVCAVQRVNPNIRVFPFSLKQSILNLYEPETLRHYFGLLQQPVVLRDSLSKGIMDRLGLDSVLGGDCVFSLAQSVDYIKPTPLRNPSRTLFVVKGRKADLLEVLRDLMRGGVELELLSTCPAEDDAVYGEIARTLGLPYRTPLGWEEIIAEFRASGLVITNRLHGLILGSIAGVSLLPVADRKKSLAFVRDADMPCHATSSRGISTGLIDEARANSKLILSRIRTYIDHCQQQLLSPFNRK